MESVSIPIFDFTYSYCRLPRLGSPALKLRAFDIARIKSHSKLSLSLRFDDGIYDCSMDLFPKRSEYACRVQSEMELDHAIPGSIGMMRS